MLGCTVLMCEFRTLAASLRAASAAACASFRRCVRSAICRRRSVTCSNSLTSPI